MSETMMSPETPAEEEARLVAEFHERERRSEARYPSSDGKPMSENDVQGNAIRYFDVAVRLNWYADAPNVYVTSDLLMYAKAGDRGAVAAPDLMVVIGTRDLPRNSYRLWDEPKPPDFVLEVASKSSWRRDLKEKKAIYESMGVKEYFACDPRAEFYQPPLQGFRLRDGAYVTLTPSCRSGVWELPSEVLGLTFRQYGEEVRLRNPATGEDLPTYDELHRTQRSHAARADKETARRRAAEEQRRAAEVRIAELEALVAQQRTSAPKRSE